MITYPTPNDLIDDAPKDVLAIRANALISHDLNPLRPNAYVDLAIGITINPQLNAAVKDNGVSSGDTLKDVLEAEELGREYPTWLIKHLLGVPLLHNPAVIDDVYPISQ